MAGRGIIPGMGRVLCINPLHYKQLLTYLRVSDKRLGLLINFGMARAKGGIKRLAYNLED
jgi:GxxExxY protein